MNRYIKKFQRIWTTLAERDDAFQSTDERYFCRRYISRIENDLQDISIPIGIAYNFASAALIPIIGEMNHVTESLIVMHAVVALLSISAFIKSSRQHLARLYLMPALLFFAPLSYLAATSEFIQTDNSAGTLLMTSIALVVSIFAILISPAKSFVYIPLATIISSFAIYSTFNHPFGNTLSLIFVLANLATASFRRMQHLRQLALAKQEYALLLQAAPAKIIRHSAESQKTITDLFAPQELQCVCLSSDWRGYQTLSANKSAKDIAVTLGEYYKACGELLAKWLPEGNYYADWIADELFVVAFSKDARGNREVANQMLLFSAELIQFKQSFYKKYGFPEAIDIGISSGAALIGMMGPDWHKKATALGEVPGQSRRYQAAGKLLRVEIGQTDRIIFGPETLLMIERPFDIAEFKVSDAKKIRDIDTKSIYFLAPLVAPEASFDAIRGDQTRESFHAA
jgi:hypothetical protein